MSTVKEVMNKDVAVVAPSVSITEAARIMSEKKTEVIAVCQGRHFEGTLTQTDIISAIVSRTSDPCNQSVIEVMHNDLPRISPGINIHDAARLMAEHSALYLPVVQNGKLQGILTIEDLLHESPTLAVMVLSRYSARDESSSATHEHPCISI